MGTGLTMADCIATLSRLGHRGPITAFSRRLVVIPGQHRQLLRRPWPGEYDQGSLRQRLRWCARCAPRGRAGASLAGGAGRGTSAGTAHLADPDVCRPSALPRHLRRYWDVHRYRIAPQVAEVIEQRQREGSLKVLAARLTALESEARSLTLTLTLREGERIALTVDRLILTTGPAHGGLIDSQPLLRELARRGLIRADKLGLGLDVDAHSRAIGREGRAIPNLLISGPAARGYFGELMGLPQVADHAAAVAAEALQALGIGQSADVPRFNPPFPLFLDVLSVRSVDGMHRGERYVITT